MRDVFAGLLFTLCNLGLFSFAMVSPDRSLTWRVTVGGIFLILMLLSMLYSLRSFRKWSRSHQDDDNQVA